MTDNLTIRIYGASPDGLREQLQQVTLKGPLLPDVGERCECPRCREQREIAWLEIEKAEMDKVKQ